MIEPDRDDVDFYSFRVRAGDILAIEVVRGNLDSIIGVFDADTGELLVADDDGGNGLLSRLLLQADADLRLAVAVSTFPDVEFVGAGATQRTLFAVHQYLSRHADRHRRRRHGAGHVGQAVQLPGPGAYTRCS